MVIIKLVNKNNIYTGNHEEYIGTNECVKTNAIALMTILEILIIKICRNEF